MQRWLAAVCLALILSGAYRVYCHFVLPLVEMQGEAAPPPPEKMSDFPAFTEVAELQFPDFEWTKTAAIKWQLLEQDAYLFSEIIEPVEGGVSLGDQRTTGSSLKFTPLAILWHDPKRPQAAPYRIVAESARIQFENEFFHEAFDFSQFDVGRILACALDGPVSIDGPDGLVIKGRDFVFSEGNAELSTYHAVQFEYGPTTSDDNRLAGAADGMNLRLIPTAEPTLGKQLPRVGGAAAINLRQNVRLQIKFEQKGRPAVARITSKGPAEYDFQARKGIFEQEVRASQQVENARGEQFTDRLVCESLGLQLEPDPQHPAPVVDEERPALPELRGLRLRLVHALGRPAQRNRPEQMVILESQEYGVLANLDDLRYDPVDHIAELRDQEQVVLQRGATKFGCPYARLVHTAENELVSLDCVGPGQLTHPDARFPHGPIKASWKQGVTVRPDEAATTQVVTLSGETRLDIPENLSIVADRTTLWLAMDQIQALQHQAEAETTSTKSDDMLRQPLPLQKAEAEGNVFVISPELIVGRADQKNRGGARRITLQVEPGEVAEEQGSSILQAGGQEPDKQAEPMYVEADDLVVHMAHDMQAGRLGVRQVEGEGKVRIEQHSTETLQIGNLTTERQLTVTAVSFVAYNAGNDEQVVTLIGRSEKNGDVTDPARVALGPFVIEGGLLTLDRRGNVASVEGPGRMTFPVPVGLGGEPLNEPAEMMIVWRERMNFDGLLATFHGAVQASLQNDAENISRAECEQLQVELLSRVNFRETPDQQAPADLKSLDCQHNVRLDAYAYEATRLVGRRHAELASFHFDRPSGDVTGQGPGKIEFWSFGSSVRIAQQKAPVANRPVDPEAPSWRYTKVMFQGGLKGNSQREHAELNDDVEIISAPVEKYTQTFQRHDLSQIGEQAANAAWIGCDTLHMNYSLTGTSKQRAAELLAIGATELEAQQFHATADEIKFEERQGRFTLRGHGKDALLHFQKVAGNPWDTTSNRLIEFTPSLPRISVDGSTGINGGL